jgi:photosystem II stability/assembly factor-like uncharacterized protein
VRVPVSEESGVAFFSWRRGDAVIASVAVDDFENFAILGVPRAEAAGLALALRGHLWNPARFEEYRAEIDSLSASGRWRPLYESLDTK